MHFTHPRTYFSEEIDPLRILKKSKSVHFFTPLNSEMKARMEFSWKTDVTH